MALINYVEPMNIASVGALLIMGVVAYLIFVAGKSVVRLVNVVYTHLSKRMLVQDVILDEIAKERGIDLDEELLRTEMMFKKRKNLSDRLSDEMYDRLFPEKNGDKK